MSPQQSIGHYRILSKLGEGGMGAVYRASDTKLNREVAIKVLPPAFAQDSGRMQRFEREAHLLATLNHPNIASVYGLEKDAIVMELVEGTTLAGPLPPATVIDYARQMAAGLEAAHEKGIVHRDLKPANIKVTSDGVIKLLDFGLAKSGDPVSSAPGVSPTISPTLSLAMTQAGMILGTAAYMSPEQARGKTVDRRADIWAFGLILYELLTGVHPFGMGETVTDTLAAIVLKDVDFAALPRETPPGLRRLIEHCLRKDPKQRLAHIADARILLEEPVAATVAPSSPAPARRNWIPWAVAGLAIAGLGADLVWNRHVAEGSITDTVRLSVPLPPDTTWPTSSSATQWVPSPDGRNLAMILTAGGRTSLWVRPLNSNAAHPLANTDGANYPFWSPDGQSIAFFTDAALRRIPVAGGAAVSICDVKGGAQNGSGDGGTWNAKGLIVFGDGNRTLMQVPASGGTAVPATTLEENEQGHYWPQFLPDGRHILFETRGGSRPGIYVQEIGSPKRVFVMKSNTRAMWSPPGFLLFTREETLLAQRMNLSTYQLEGDPVPVAPDVNRNEGNGRSTFAVSLNGVLVYRPGGATTNRLITWRDRSGKILQSVGKPGPVSYTTLSPDAKTAALLMAKGSGVDLAALDLSTGLATPLVADAPIQGFPIWSPDSTRMALALNSGTIELVTVASARVESLEAKNLRPVAWMPNADSLLCIDASGKQLSVVPIGSGQAPKVISVTAYVQAGHVISPDGNYIAYTSFEAGGNSEVFVAAFPSFSVKRRLSMNGGNNALWSKDGKAIYYLAADHSITEVEVRASSSDIQFGEPKPLLKAAHHFGVSADGQRFLLGEEEDLRVGGGTAAAPELAVVLNWLAETKPR